MNYYKAQEQDTAPFLTFEQVANSLAQLQSLGLEKDPLIVEEDRLTNPLNPDFISYEFGICHKRIVNGLLEDVLPADIADASKQQSEALNVQKTKEAGKRFDSQTFEYARNHYPLNLAAICIYKAIIQKGEVNQVMSIAGPITIEALDLVKFEGAMIDAIIQISDDSL